LKRLLQFNRFRKSERGVQLVEVAIVLPIFAVLLAATAEFGRYFYEYTTLAKASRVGARYLSTARVATAEDTIAKNIVVYGNPAGTGSPILTGLQPSHIVITRAGGLAVLPQTVRVEVVGYKHQPIFDLGKLTKKAGLSLNIDVKPSVTMRYLLTTPPPLL
jgi:Flp pilus assembly protein TadG